MSGQLKILGIGNAIVDVIARTDDAFLAAQGMAKGAMILIDEAQAEAIYATMAAGREVSGGSGANSIAGIAALGVPTGFVGKVRDDQLGAVFSHDIRAAGAEFITPAATDGPATARCLILVTPDGQRTMNTFLGACQGLSPADIDPAQVARAEIIYLEGYLWDPPAAKDAFRRAIEVAHGNGSQVAFTTSDGFCVDRHRAEFQALIRESVDILFANESEALSLTQTNDFDSALQSIRQMADVVALTRSERGAVILAGDEVHVIDAVPGVSVVDTTGAGDLFAAGFLAGLAQGRSYHDCGVMGTVCAAEIIGHFGARPEADLKALVAARL